jgi:hypothetical protein
MFLLENIKTIPIRLQGAMKPSEKSLNLKRLFIPEWKKAPFKVINIFIDAKSYKIILIYILPYLGIENMFLIGSDEKISFGLQDCL